MKDKNVKAGMKVQLKMNFGAFGATGDTCVVLHRDDLDLSHKLKNLCNGKEFYRRASGYRKFKGESK